MKEPDKMTSSRVALPSPTLVNLTQVAWPRVQSIHGLPSSRKLWSCDYICAWCMFAHKQLKWVANLERRTGSSLHLMASVNIPLKSLCRASLNCLSAIPHSPFTTQPPDLAKIHLWRVKAWAWSRCWCLGSGVGGLRAGQCNNIPVEGLWLR